MGCEAAMAFGWGSRLNLMEYGAMTCQTGEGKEEYIGQENVTIGTWKDGLQNGEMECWFEGNPEFHDNSHLGHWKYTCIDGVPQARYKRSGKMFFAVCLECDGLNWSGATAPMGIYPFADAFDKYEVRSDNFEQ